MVLWITKWDINPDQLDEYDAWVQRTLSGVVGAGGFVELRAYRPVTGSHRAAMTIEFADLVSWQAWYDSDVVQAAYVSARAVWLNTDTELWGPSPVVPQPIRPGG